MRADAKKTAASLLNLIHMRIVIHDYAGHPPQVYLSRALARKGHDVLHLYASGLQTPRGGVMRLPADPPGFALESVSF